MHELSSRVLNSSVMIDGEQMPATPRRYFETADRPRARHPGRPGRCRRRQPAHLRWRRCTCRLRYRRAPAWISPSIVRVEILSEEQYQVLGFVDACNRNHYTPTETQVTLWREHPLPRDAVYRTVRRGSAPTASLDTAVSRMHASMMSELMRPVREAMVANMSIAFQRVVSEAAGSLTEARELVTQGESPVAHLVRLGWLKETGSRLDAGGNDEQGLQLTDLGRALLRDAEREATPQEEVGVVVLEAGDSLAYPVLIGQFAAAGEGLLVDPYLKLADLNGIVVSTRLTRVLVSAPKNHRGQEAELAAMATHLNSASLSRHVEVRSSTDLHDRVLLANEGDVMTLGTSLNGVGRKTTVFTPVPSPAREALRMEYERLWSEATLVGPSPTDSDDIGDSTNARSASDGGAEQAPTEDS